MPTSSDFLGGISVNDSGSAEQVNHRAVQLLKTGAGSRHLRRYDYVPTGMRRQHADRFAQAAAKTVAHHSPSPPPALQHPAFEHRPPVLRAVPGHEPMPAQTAALLGLIGALGQGNASER